MPTSGNVEPAGSGKSRTNHDTKAQVILTMHQVSFRNLAGSMDVRRGPFNIIQDTTYSGYAPVETPNYPRDPVLSPSFTFMALNLVYEELLLCKRVLATEPLVRPRTCSHGVRDSRLPSP